MDDKDLLVDAVPNRQVAEQLREEVVDFDVVLMLDFALETIHLVQRFGLVVAAAHEKVLWQAYFPSEHGHQHFDRE